MTISDPKYYVIRNADDDQLFWCNKNGWVETPHETYFTAQERMELSLPMGGVWVLVSKTVE